MNVTLCSHRGFYIAFLMEFDNHTIKISNPGLFNCGQAVVE